MGPNARRATVALALALLIFAVGACLADAVGHHGDATAPFCVVVIALGVIPVPVALASAGWLAPRVASVLPAVALELAAPPPRV